MRPIEVFFSYSHRDERLRDQLERHLTILARQGIIAGWHDRKIIAGEDWGHKIDAHLETAPLILLLVSSDFVASDYCYGEEVKRAIKRHDAGEATVIPVILRPVDWSSAPFGQLQALPKDAQPVTSWSNQDEAFVNVAMGIRAAVDTIVAARKTTLDQYEQAFAAAVQRTYPLSAEAHTILQQLQYRLRLKDEDILSIEERSTTPIREFRQKSLRYRQEAERLVQEDVGDVSPVSRSILDTLRSNLELHPDDAARIEEDVLKPYYERKEVLQRYEEALVLAMQQENPLQAPMLSKLKRLQDLLHLSDEDVRSINPKAAVPVTTPPEDDLSSRHKIQYGKLRDLLKSGKWKEADRETYVVMLKAVDKEGGNWISREEMENFDCVDLRTIDQLWVKYSDKRFGFSVQRRIWEDCGAKPGKYEHEIYKQFGDRVGWRVADEWLAYNELTFDLGAQQGHLPAWYGGLIVASLFFRAKSCMI